MSSDIVTSCDHLMVGVLNGVCQGIIFAGAVALGLRMFRRTNAATRYAIWSCTLLVLVFLVVVHGWIGVVFPTDPGTKVHVREVADRPESDLILSSGVSVPDAVLKTEFNDPSGAALGGVETVVGDERSRSVLRQFKNSEPFDTPKENSFSEWANINRSATGESPRTGKANSESNGNWAVTKWHLLTSRLLNPKPLNLPTGFGLPRSARLLLVMVGFVMIGARVCVFVSRVFRIRRLKRSSISSGAELNEAFQRLVTCMRVNRRIELRVSATYRSSCLLGFLNPVVLLPAEESMTTEEAELVLRHELAHARRYDDWANLLQQFILAAFPFHPAIWWISRQISLEREIACDDQVLNQGGNTRAYALLLTNLAQRMRSHALLLAPGASNNRTQLHERIDMILNRHRNTFPHIAKSSVAFITSGTVFAALAIVCFSPRIALAQHESDTAVEVPRTATVVSSAPAEGDVVVVSSDAPEAGSGDSVENSASATVSSEDGPGQAAGSADLRTRGARKFAFAIAPPPATPATPSKLVTGGSYVAAGAASLEPDISPGRRVASRQTIDPSIEQRLDRLEQMVESLVSNRKVGGTIDAGVDSSARMGLKKAPDLKEGKTARELAKLDALTAIEHSKRAAEEIERSQRAEQKQRISEVSQRELEVLRMRLDALDRERQALNQQIEQLERQQEQLNERAAEQLEEGEAQPEREPKTDGLLREPRGQ